MSAHLLTYPLPLADINNNRIVGGTISFYEAGGSSTPKEVWSDYTLLTSAGFSVDTDSYGLPEKSGTSIEVYGDGDYYVVIKDAAGNTIRDYEWLEEIFIQTEPDEWVASGLTPSYISATSFSVPGDQTEILDVGRMLRIQLYRPIITSVYTTLTTITVATGLTSPITSFEYSFQNGTNQSLPDPIDVTDINVSNDLTVGNNAIITGDVDAETGTIDALTADTITAETTNGNLSLSGNGTGIVDTDSLTATTTNGDLALTGNGTGIVSIDGLKKKIIDIGDWNMQSLSTATVAHGLTFTNIRSINATIRNDANTQYFSLFSISAAGTGNNSIYADATNVNLARYAASWFDAAAFSSTSYNRGWIVIEYIG